VSEPSLDVSRFGTAYLTFTAPGAGGHDVRVAELEDTDWTLVPDPVDIDLTHDAFGARVAASSDGTGIVAFTERDLDGTTHVYERRLLRTRLSSVPQEASLGSLSNRKGGNADTPAVDVHDESSFAWVAFRQDFVDGGVTRSRVVARRLVGSAFDFTAQIDGLRFPPSQVPVRPAISLSGRGYGIALTTMSSNSLTGAVLTRRRDPLQPTFEPPVPLEGGNASPPLAVASSSESAHGLAAWQRTVGGGHSIVARYYNGTQFASPVNLSPPALGPAEAELGLDAEGDDADDDIVAFVQGGAAARRIQVVAYAGELSVSRISDYRRWRRNTRPVLRWLRTPAVPWGPVRYRIEVDGDSIGTTSHTKLRPKNPISEGVHATRVVAIDGRGSETQGRDYGVRIDTRDPSGKVRSRGKGVWQVWASDGPIIEGSGIHDARLDFGSHGAVPVPVPEIGIVEGVRIRTRTGIGRPRLIVRDNAGNSRVIG
jgi:hypothetical protein